MSQSQANVSMFYRFGEENLPLGKCHPSQARILVRKELATWEDGNLKVILRPAHSEILDRDPYQLIRRAEDDQNVSKAELDRRLDWFKQFARKATMALGELGRPGQDISQEAVEEGKRRFETIRELATTEAVTYKKFTLIPKTMNIAEAMDFFLDEKGGDLVEADLDLEALPENTEKELPSLWDTSPDVSEVFQPKKVKITEETTEKPQEKSVETLSDLWETAPDVSETFAVTPSKLSEVKWTDISYESAPSANKSHYEFSEVEVDFVGDSLREFMDEPDFSKITSEMLADGIQLRDVPNPESLKTPITATPVIVNVTQCPVRDNPLGVQPGAAHHYSVVRTGFKIPLNTNFRFKGPEPNVDFVPDTPILHLTDSTSQEQKE